MIDWVEAWFHPERSLGAASDYNLANTALPIWVGLIVIELAASNALGKKVYSLRQSISNLSSGLLMLTFMGERARERRGCTRRQKTRGHICFLRKTQKGADCLPFPADPASTVNLQAWW